jgi:hypothetical protein
MKALAIILAAILLLFGLLAGGCAICLLEGPSLGVAPGLLAMMVATLLITSAVLILRKAKRKPTQSPPELPRDDAPQL